MHIVHKANYISVFNHTNIQLIILSYSISLLNLAFTGCFQGKKKIDDIWP